MNKWQELARLFDGFRVYLQRLGYTREQAEEKIFESLRDVGAEQGRRISNFCEGLRYWEAEKKNWNGREKANS